MTENNIKNTLIEEINTLEFLEQQQVLEFVRSLHPSNQNGGAGSIMAVRRYDFQAEDIAEIEQAILEECEKIDTHEW